MDDFSARRRRSQPPGASLGSMFKNPSGDFAGRLIEAAGLKSTRIGGAEISPVHANFFINLGDATADDIGQLISQAQRLVQDQFGILLELEVELLGDWSNHSIVRTNHGR
jgi:UDP-N-acetylmuramate dehydrogenase